MSDLDAALAEYELWKRVFDDAWKHAARLGAPRAAIGRIEADDALITAQAQRIAALEAERDAFAELAESMCHTLALEGVGSEDCERLSILRGLADIAAGRVKEITNVDDLLADAADAEPTPVRFSLLRQRYGTDWSMRCLDNEDALQLEMQAGDGDKIVHYIAGEPHVALLLNEERQCIGFRIEGVADDEA